MIGADTASITRGAVNYF